MACCGSVSGGTESMKVVAEAPGENLSRSLVDQEGTSRVGLGSRCFQWVKGRVSAAWCRVSVSSAGCSAVKPDRSSESLPTRFNRLRRWYR